jgi:hypothetical protein
VRRFPSSFAVPFALAALLAAPPGGGRDLLLPGPGPRPHLEPVAGIGLPTDAGCARCHAEIADEWESSLHHRAFENGYFLRAYALEPTPFCRKCHAPSADPSSEPPREARELGVGCTTCHVIPAGIVGVRAMPARPGAHEVLGDARLGAELACGGCHDFPFPGPPGEAPRPMQDTLGEHRRSAAAATPCQGCHMLSVPSRGGGTHKSHAFRVQGDRAFLARAVVVESAALGEGEMRLSLRPGAIGHAFPTGDLFRQVEIRALPLDDKGAVLPGGSSEVLARSFAAEKLGAGMAKHVQTADTRLSGARTFTLPLPRTARRARYEIVWQRLPPELAARLGLVMREQEKVILEGALSR